ncbi:Uncharacterised protein [Escherichia coli]|nr:Uncharacterised protein [Escherichia coli]
MPSGFIFSTSSAEVCARNDGQSTTSIHQHTQDVALGTKIISHDVERQLVFFFRFWQAAGQCPAPLCPAIGFCGGYFFCQIHAVQTWERNGLFLTPAPHPGCHPQ